MTQSSVVPLVELAFRQQFISTIHENHQLLGTPPHKEDNIKICAPTFGAQYGYDTTGTVTNSNTVKEIYLINY